ncbi:MAG: UDP-3-O-acyl-N-acetylglucosamine deacetylase [Pseudomonadota bacterium]
MFQNTLKTPIVCAGVGVHSGERVRLVMKPAPAGAGLVFIRSDITDRPNAIAAHVENVSSTKFATTLTNQAGVSVTTVEHLLAACAGLGLDNAVFEIDGAEPPVLDGASKQFCELILKAGLTELAAPRRFIRVLKPVTVEMGAKRASISPSDSDWLTVRASIDYQCKRIGRQSAAFELTPGVFLRDIAFARTFALFSDVEALCAMGLARGGSLDNTVVVDEDRVLNPEGLRAGDEFVRHKILDVIGDLMLAGAPIAGVYEAEQPGHSVNAALVAALMADPAAWRWAAAAQPEFNDVERAAAG